MAYTFDISPTNPLKFYSLSDFIPALGNGAAYNNSFDPNINNRGFDDDFFVRNIKPWDYARFWAQPYQQGDVVKVQWLGAGAGIGLTYTAYLIDCDNRIYKTLTITSPSLTLIDSQQIYEVSLPLYNIAEGYYRMVLKYDFLGSDISFVISEPIDVRSVHPQSLWIKYTNSSNDFGVIWQYGIEFQARCYGTINNLTMGSQFNVYEDEPLNMTMLSGIAYRNWELQVGGNGNPIPDWFGDKLERIMLCDTVDIDGTLYTRAKDSKWEVNRKPQTVLSSYKLSVREAVNDNSLYQDQYQKTQYIATIPEGAKYIYAHDLTYAVGGPTQVRKIFEGTVAMVNYLNQVTAPALSITGLFALDDLNRLVFIPGSTSEATTYNGITFDDLYLYGIKCKVVSTGGQDFYCALTTPGTTEYAWSSNGGTTITKGTVTAGTATLNTAALAAGTYTIYVCVSATEAYDLTTGTAQIKAIDGDLSTTTTDLDITSANVRSVGDLWRFCGGTLTTISLGLNRITSGNIDRIIKRLYDSGVAALAFNYDLSGQTPAAPPSEQVKQVIVSQLVAGGGTLITD